MHFNHIRNHLPEEDDDCPIWQQCQSFFGIQPDVQDKGPSQMVYKRHKYNIGSKPHWLVGLWVTDAQRCGIAVTQSIKGEPTASLTLVLRPQGRKPDEAMNQFSPTMLCRRGVEAFMLKTVLTLLEVFDEEDPDLLDKLEGAWRELVSRYSDSSGKQLVEVTIHTYQYGCSRGPSE